MLRTLLLTALLSASALAVATPAPKTPDLGANITLNYKADDLKSAYAILNIAAGDIWVLNLPDDVVDIVTSKDGVLQFQKRGNRVVIGATASSGSYPVLVMTQDSVFFFQARLSASRGGGLHNIVVQAGEGEAAAAAPKPPSGAMAAAPARLALPTLPKASAAPSVPAAQVAAPQSAAQPRSQQTPAAPAVPAPSVPVKAAPQPDAGLLRVEYRALTDGQVTRLYYKITNVGTLPVLYSEQGLRVSTNSAVPYERNKTKMLVVSGKTVYGEVLLRGVPTLLNATWGATSLTGQAVAGSPVRVTVEQLN